MVAYFLTISSPHPFPLQFTPLIKLEVGQKKVSVGILGFINGLNLQVRCTERGVL